MDLNFTPEEEAFRAEVQAFLQDKLPARLSRKIKAGVKLSKAEHEEWHAILQAQGWLATIWPQEYGGPGWDPVRKFIFENECALANAPRIEPFGIVMLGPVLIHFGNEAQKRHWLPRILNGDDWWCQGYSEPGAGSDLAGLKTSAERGVDAQGEHYLVNGQKTWTTLGQHANMIFCLVRTNKEGRKQEGISFLLIDMNTPGIEVRPIITIEGGHEVNEVFFTNVRVPAENLVGGENKGWTIAKFLLGHERTGIAGVGFSVALLEKLKVVAGKVLRNGRPLAQDPAFAARMAKVEIELENMKTTNLRVLAAVASGTASGAESSMLKIKGSEIRQELYALIRRAVGPYALPFAAGWLKDLERGEPFGPEEAATAAAMYFNYRKLSIYGGSNEVQKNIISKMVLGL